MKSTDVDAVILGAGVIGASIAFVLSSGGRTVALLDTGKAGHGTSNASFAWVNATSKSSHRQYHDLNVAGMRAYRELARDWGEETIGYHPCGMLAWVDASDESGVAALTQRAEQLRSWDYPITLVNKTTLESLEPHVDFPADCVGFHALADAWLDVPSYISFLIRRIRENGGVIVEHCGETELLMDGGGEEIAGIRTEQHSFATRRLIVATGPDTPKALSALTGHDFEARFPMNRAPGLLVDTPSNSPWRLANHILEMPDKGQFRIRPNPNGGLRLGANDTDGMVGEHSGDAELERAARVLLDRAGAVIPKFPGAEILDRCRLKLGIRAMPADGQSVIGPILGVDGLILVMTHSGITLAPALAGLIADHVASGDWPRELEPFSFDRFQAVV